MLANEGFGAISRLYLGSCATLPCFLNTSFIYWMCDTNFSMNNNGLAITMAIDVVIVAGLMYS